MVQTTVQHKMIVIHHHGLTANHIFAKSPNLRIYQAHNNSFMGDSAGLTDCIGKKFCKKLLANTNLSLHSGQELGVDCIPGPSGRTIPAPKFASFQGARRGPMTQKILIVLSFSEVHPEFRRALQTQLTLNGGAESLILQSPKQ